MARHCIIHYEHQDCTYSNIKEISDVNKKQIITAKSIREELGGENYHQQQCESIPSIIDDSIHGIHTNPCYKKFTKIISVVSARKRKASSELNLSPDGDEHSSFTKRLKVNSANKRKCDTNPSSLEELGRPKCQKLSSPTSNKLIYDNICYFCKTYRIQRNKQNFYPITLPTKEAETKLKNVAKESDEKTFYYEIKELDLIAKEFRYHRECYREYTRGKSTLNEKELVYERGNIQEVLEYVNRNVIEMNQAVSMGVLHDIYGLGLNDTRYRNKLKAKLQTTFPEQLYFLSIDKVHPEVVISSDALNVHTIFNNKQKVVDDAAKYLHDDIIQYISSIPDNTWPPDLENLLHQEENFPELLKSFFKQLLQGNTHSVRTASVNILINSFVADMISAVSNGKVITAKQYLLGLGLHNLTGQKKPIKICHSLGHCIDYNLTCEIETALAEKSIIKAKESSILPLLPASEEEYVLTYFWADNFDTKVEKQTGGGAINTTHLVAFQEEGGTSTKKNEFTVSFPRSKKRRIQVTESEQPNLYVNPKKQPRLIPTGNSNTVDNQLNFTSIEEYLSILFQWLIKRMCNSSDQELPTFQAWVAESRNRSSTDKVVKTSMAYLPPINAKVTEYSTIYQYLTYMQTLAGSVNMPYVNVTLDVGAAINAYKLIWNYPEHFANIIIHLGDFHFLAENFRIIGEQIVGSGFEDIIFQSGVCTVGSLNGVLAGSHYNRAWVVHIALYEALERLLLKQFETVTCTEIPNKDFFTKNEVEYSHEMHDIIKDYNKFKETVRKGSSGKTAQFWCNYLELMRMQIISHLAIHENNFDLRLECWKYFIPFYFSLDKQNYARYGSYYVYILENIENVFPGLKVMIENKGLSVQAQDNFDYRTCIDQRGEQTLNKDAKTSGGVKYFSADENAVLKWTLNRAEQSLNTTELLRYAGLKERSELRKALRPSQIIKSENCVGSIKHVLEEEFLNPFNPDLDKDMLHNLSSGVGICDSISEDVLKVREIGVEAYESFVENRLRSTNKLFHDPISRQKLKVFKDSSQKATVVVKNVQKEIEINRNILGTLLAQTINHNKLIDFKKALEYPLTPLPLSIANADGSRRVTCKSKLITEILECSKSTTYSQDILPVKTNVSVYIVDLMALIRTITTVPVTYEDLTFLLIKMIPAGYPQVDMVADTYMELSVKSAERKKRGSSTKVLIKSGKSKIPRNFSQFLNNGENKENMLAIIASVITENGDKALKTLNSQKLIISLKNKCIKVTPGNISEQLDLCSNQEEADTKLALHCDYAMRDNKESKIIVRSPSGDVDILVILLGVLDNLNCVYLDSGTGNARKCIPLGDIDLTVELRKSLIGFHSFTGNDFVSSFLKKGKHLCWKVLQKYPKFLDAFQTLGKSWNLPNETKKDLENYVCCLYGQNNLSVNDVRHKFFEKRYKKEKKIVEISVLPPCQSSLTFHSERSNFISCIWRHALNKTVNLPNPELHGWKKDYTPIWVDKIMPENIGEILLDIDQKAEENTLYGNEEESEDEDDI